VDLARAVAISAKLSKARASGENFWMAVTQSATSLPVIQGDGLGDVELAASTLAAEDR
jgi:hypothetical protein